MPATSFALALVSSLALQEGSVWRHEGGQAGAELGRTLATGDLNGDGFGDLVVGAPLFDGPRGADSGRVSAFLGSAACNSSAPDWNASGERPRDGFGSALAVLDLDGDGFDDLCVGAPEHDIRAGRAVAPAALGHGGPALASGEGAVYAYLGSAAGLAAMPQRVVRGIELGERLGSALAPVNTNGDAFEDLLVGGPGKLQGLGSVFLFPGTPSGLHGQPVWLRVGASTTEEYGRIFGSLGDQDGDGDEEFLVSVPRRFATGTLEIFLGSPTGPGATPDRTAGRRIERLGDSVDIDQDGALETLFVNASEPRLVQWRELWPVGAVASRELAASLTSVATGDLDGDGRVDVVASGSTFEHFATRGRVWSLLNVPGEVLEESARDLPVLDGLQDGAEWGAALATLDADGDGADEVVVAAPRQDGAEVDEGLVALFPDCKPTLRLDRRALPEGFVDGTSGDFDGDGFDDLVTQVDRQRLGIRFGSENWLAEMPDAHVDLPPYPGFANVLVELVSGDFDGDGYDDVLACTFPGGAGEQLLYLGSPQGLHSTYLVVAAGDGHADAIGDVNGDGREDVMIRRFDRRELHLGHPQGLSTTVWQSFPNTFIRLQAIDLDADGFGDVIGARDNVPFQQTILFRGSAAGLIAEAAPLGTDPGVWVDLDHDGDDDQVTPCFRNVDGVLVRTRDWWDLAGPARRGFDANADGIRDVWFRGESLHLGSPAGLQRIPAWVAADLDFVDFHGQGDFDGDGNLEFLVDLALGPEVFEFVRL